MVGSVISGPLRQPAFTMGLAEVLVGRDFAHLTDVPPNGAATDG
jgi:hypothetical protein